MGEESLKRGDQYVAFGQVKFDMLDQSFACLLSYSFLTFLCPLLCIKGHFPVFLASGFWILLANGSHGKNTGRQEERPADFSIRLSVL